MYNSSLSERLQHISNLTLSANVARTLLLSYLFPRLPAAGIQLF